MGAVPVECLDVHDDGAFDGRLVAGVGEGRSTIGIALYGHDSGVAVDLESPAVRVIIANSATRSSAARLPVLMYCRLPR